MNSIDWNKARAHEDELLKYATLKLSEFENLKIIGTASNKGPLISFIFDDIHWSSGMENAWEYIKSHKKTTLTIDLFFVGIVFIKSELSKENFIIRF